MVTNQECKLLRKGPIIYRSIVDGKIEKPSYVKKRIEVLNNSEKLAFEYLFQTKVKNIYDSKIAEFNFKVFHGILPCQKNLVKWKVETDKSCPRCKGEHDIVVY